MDNRETYDLSSARQSKLIQKVNEIEQFQCDYVTVQRQFPEIFQGDHSLRLKFEDQLLSLQNPKVFHEIHKHLSTSPITNRRLPEGIEEKVQMQIDENKTVWESWWAKKIKANLELIKQAKKGNYAEVAKLIDQSYNGEFAASVNYQEPQSGFTALHYAVQRGDLGMTNLLLENYADTSVQDSNRQTALHLACSRGDLEIYKSLIAKNPYSKNCIDKNQNTPISLAFQNKHEKIIEYDKQQTINLFGDKKKKMTPNDFNYIQSLGQGAFGEVFLVEKDDKFYAMKALKKRRYNGLMNFIITEKDVQRRIRHRYIVRLRFAFQTFDKLFLVMDYCPGGDMRTLISMKKRIKEDDARIYLAEVLLALEQLHKSGIIHRDIKPDNIMIDQEGHALITDFGLAKEGIFEKKLTNTILGGGQSYLIPEVIQNQSYDKSVDLYLYGLLAYEIMVGKPVFPSNEHEDIIKKKILKQQYDQPKGLSETAKDFLQKLIQIDPSKRLNIHQIKKHPFFSSIDFNEVAEGKVKPPPPIIRSIQKSFLPQSLMDSECENSLNQSQEDNHLDQIQQELNMEFGEFVCNVDGTWSPSKNKENNLKVDTGDQKPESYVFDFERENNNGGSFNNADNLTKIPNFSYIGDQSQKVSQDKQ